MTQVITSLFKSAYAWAKPAGNTNKVSNFAHETADDKRNERTKVHIAASLSSCHLAFSEFFKSYANFLQRSRHYSNLGDLAYSRDSIKALRATLKFIDNKLEDAEKAIADRRQYLFPSSKED